MRNSIETKTTSKAFSF